MAKPNKSVPLVTKNEQPLTQPTKSEIVYVVEKVKQIDYKLIKLTIENNVIVSREMVARDIPMIIQGKYMMLLGSQDFTE